MATSRTSLAPHRNFRRRVLARDRAAGITNCPLCGVVLDYDNSRTPNSAEPDHIIPDARGGTNATSNGRAICRHCNQSRGDRPDPVKVAPAVTPKPIKTSGIW